MFAFLEIIVALLDLAMQNNSMVLIKFQIAVQSNSAEKYYEIKIMKFQNFMVSRISTSHISSN